MCTLRNVHTNSGSNAGMSPGCFKGDMATVAVLGNSGLLWSLCLALELSLLRNILAYNLCTLDKSVHRLSE